MTIARHRRARQRVAASRRRSTRSPPRSEDRRRHPRAGRRARTRARPRRRRRRSPAWRRCCTSTRRISRSPTAENLAAQVARVVAGRRLLARPRAGDRLRQERDAARRGAARRRADLRHHRRRSRPTRSCGRSMRATCSRRCSRSDPIKVITVRTTGFDAAAATGGNARDRDASPRRPTPACREVTGQELIEIGAPRAHQRAHRHLRRARPRQRARTSSCSKRSPTSSTRRSARRARRSTRATCPNDYQVGPDRQDRRARPLHRRRHLRRDPASRRHEGQQGDRRDQQGSPRRRSSRSPTTAWSATCSRSFPSSPPR